MKEVSDTDLAEYMLNVDSLDEHDPRKPSLREPMLPWPCCLIQAIDYLHEMRVNHKDIKPANILVMGGRAADIYALGCVFLEIATVLVGAR